MKKLFIILFAIVGITSCKCTKDTPVVIKSVEQIVTLDKQAMFLEYEKDYKWYETSVVLKDFLDQENDGTISGVSNIFQVQREVGQGMDVHVIMYTHVGDTTDVQVVPTFWIEDFPLNDEAILISFEKAFELINEVNLPKPHSRQVVLRKEVGPVAANPQWIFGNQILQIYVDATTGEVRDYNPAYPQNAQLGYTFTW